jgi:hypothetical protein
MKKGKALKAKKKYTKWSYYFPWEIFSSNFQWRLDIREIKKVTLFYSLYFFRAKAYIFEDQYIFTRRILPFT